jgi:hypothetical protein
MSARSVRLIVKQYGFELTAVLAVLLAAAALGLIVAARLPGLVQQAAACGDGFECAGILDDAARMRALGGLVSVVAAVVGAFGGIVLGVAVVGREVERGTAALAWSLVRSRRRWLLVRVAVISVLLAIAALIPSMVADRLVPTLFPGNDAASSFIGFETRGLLPVGRDLAAFAIGILAGALFGRVLPGLILGLALAAAGSLGLGAVVGAWRLADAVAISMDSPDQVISYETNLILDTRYRDGAGNLLSANDVFSHVPAGELPPGWPDSVYETVNVGIPGIRHPEIDRREAALMAAIGAILLGGSLLVVERRRPY